MLNSLNSPRRGLGLILILLVCSAVAFGQTETGSVNGVVKDSTGAVVVNAKVTLTSLATDAARSTTTNSSGLYSLASLKPATYKLTVEAQGFQKYERQV